MEDTILIKNVDVNKLKYSEPKVLTNGGRTVYVNYSGQRLVVQLPWLSLPYGVNDSSDLAAKLAAQAAATGKQVDNVPKNRSYDLNVSFRGSDVNPKIQQAMDKLKEIEQKIINDAYDNRESWLRDDYDGIKAVVAKLFVPTVKYDKDKNTGKIVGKYPPTMKIKIPYNEKEDQFKFDAEDKDGVEIDFKSIMNTLKSGKTLPVVQLSGMWFAGGKFGCTWKLMRARFQTTIITRAVILDDSDNEDNGGRVEETPSEEDDVVADALAASIGQVKIPETTVAESEEESEEESDDDAPPPPPPPPAVVSDKKTRKKNIT